MSANNQVVISKRMYDWVVELVDADTGDAYEHIGKTDNLEQAVDMANKYMDECADDGYPVEYGLSIIK